MDSDDERAAAPYAPVPGPVDRETFFEAQRRHRRASWWFTLWSAVAILLTGIPLSAVITPLVYLAAFLGLDLVNLVHPLGDVLAASTSNDSTAPVHWTRGLVAVAGASLLVPGALVLLGAWVGVRAMFRHAGAGGGLLHIGARDPRPGEFEEHQLVNVVAEMAVAAGVPPPRVQLIDSDVANAAVVGSSLDDATVVVTTGLLTHLGRDETQAVVGHLVASAGNGDLRIGTTILAVYQTFGLVSAFLAAPLDRTSRRTLWRAVRLLFSRRKADAGDVATLLAASEPDLSQAGNGLMGILTLPFLMASGAFMMTRMIFGFVLINPVLRRGWRARKELADASAVQLTRNPTALARALRSLQSWGGTLPGGDWAGHLFVVGPEVHAEADREQLERLTAEIRSDHEVPMSERMRRASEIAASRPRENRSGVDQPAVATFQPPLPRRIAHLHRLGADADIEVPARPRRRGCATAVLIAVFPLLAAVALVMLGCALALVVIAFAVDMLYLAMVVVPLHLLLRAIAR